MNQILALREKRAKLWNDTKTFLDSHRSEDGMVSAEDNATYEKMEADVVALGKEIERLERQAAIDREMDQPTASPLVSRPVAPSAQKQGRASDEYKTAFWGMIRNRVATPGVMNALKAKELGFCDEVLYTGAEDLPDDIAGYSFERKSAAACLMNRVIASMPKPVNVVKEEPEHPPDAEQPREEPKEPEPVTPDNRVKAADLEKRLSLLK